MTPDGGDDDVDGELASLLRASLDPGASDEGGSHAAARELGTVLSARLTERSLVLPTIQTVVVALRAAAEADRARLFGLIGWDLFEALLPWARGGQGEEEEGDSVVFELLDMALSAASGREALMMLQGALSSKPMPVEQEGGDDEDGGVYHPSAVPWMVGRMADALLRVEPARRGHFLEQTGRLWLAQVRRALQPPAESGDGEEGEEEGARAARLQHATAVVASVLLGVQRVVEDGGALTLTDAAAGARQLGSAIGLLLALLRLRPPQPPPPPAAATPSIEEGKDDGGSGGSGGGGGGFPLSRTVAALLRRALTASASGVVTAQALLSYPLLHEDIQTRHRHRTTKKSNDSDDDGQPPAAATKAAADPVLPPPDSSLAWEPAGVALAACALLCSGCGSRGGGDGEGEEGWLSLLPPSLRALLLSHDTAPLLPTPLAPAWSVQWLVAPHAALLLQQPDMAPLGLALLDCCLLRLLPPPPLDPLLPGAGREGLLRCVYEGERDVWAQTIRGLTGCIAFLSEEPPRQRAYCCLPQVVALLTHEARFKTLATTLPKAHNHVASALLVSLARKALAAAWASAGERSRWRSPAVHQFYSPALASGAAKRPEALVSMAGASGGPESEGELDQLMAALNFLRFLMLKDPRGVNATGIWDPRTLRTTLEQLRALETNVGSVLGSGDGKGRTQSSSFKLNMLAEVLSLVVPPLAEAAGDGEGVMEVDG